MKAVVSTLMVGLTAGILAVPPPADAQQSAKGARVVYVHEAALGPLEPVYLDAFRQGMYDLGWVEGRNLVLEQRVTSTLEERRAVSAEMERLKVDVVFAPVAAYWMAPVGSAPLRGIPIVFAGVADPIASGMVASLARPGGNLTGFMYLGVELNVKRLQLLHADAVLGLQGAVYYRERKRIADLALKHRLPGIFEVAAYAEAGCLMSYAPSILDLNRRAAAYVDKILKGAKPGDLPVQQPTKFELVVNLRAAKALGVELPQSFIPLAS